MTLRLDPRSARLYLITSLLRHFLLQIRKSFRIRTYKKRWEEGSKPLTKLKHPPRGGAQIVTRDLPKNPRLSLVTKREVQGIKAPASNRCAVDGVRAYTAIAAFMRSAISGAW
jgi:hypothetical protein